MHIWVVFLQFVNSILSKSCFQHPTVHFCMICGIQYRSIWNWCFTFDLLYDSVSWRLMSPWWTWRSARCLDDQLINNSNYWRSIVAHFVDAAGSILLLFLTVKGANIGKMDVCNQSEHKFPMIRSSQSLMVRWRSFPGSGREHIAVIYACKGCKSLIHGCLQPIQS